MLRHLLSKQFNPFLFLTILGIIALSLFLIPGIIKSQTIAQTGRILYIAKGGGYTGDYNLSESSTSDESVIKQALDALQPGDTLKFYPGTYLFSTPISSQKTGIVYITSAIPSNRAVLKIKPQSPSGIWSYASMLTVSFFNISNLVFDGSLGQIDGSAEGGGYFELLRINGNSIVENNLFKNGTNDGIWHRSNNIIRNNRFESVIHEAIVGDNNANSNIIENNYDLVNINKWKNAFVRLYSGRDNIYRNNILDYPIRGSSMGFFIVGSGNRDTSNNIFENNVIKNAGEACIWFHESGNSTKTTAPFMANQIIRNNLFVNCRDVVTISSQHPNANWNNITFENNTVIHEPSNPLGIQSRYAIYEWTSYGAGSFGKTGSSPVLSGPVYVKNNIFYNIKDGIASGTGGTPSYFNSSYNLFKISGVAHQAGVIVGSGNIYNTDPLFASSNDFHLKSQFGRWTDTGWVNDSVNSPAIDAGDPASAYSLEPAPNGGRINLGFYGNTTKASKSNTGATPLPATPTPIIPTSILTPTPTSILINNLTLSPGWNQISSPISEGIDMSTIENSCNLVPLNNYKLWAWNAQSQSWINPTRVEPNKGYWVNAANTCTVTLTGTPAAFTSVQLYTGWNKISAQGDISTVKGTCTIIDNQIWNWDTGNNNWTHPLTFQPNKGYWIKVSGNCTLE